MKPEIHKGCGGEIHEGTYMYRYCSQHDGCDPWNCPSAYDVPELLCSRCGEEIVSDWGIETEWEW